MFARWFARLQQQQQQQCCHVVVIGVWLSYSTYRWPVRFKAPLVNCSSGARTRAPFSGSSKTIFSHALRSAALPILTATRVIINLINLKLIKFPWRHTVVTLEALGTCVWTTCPGSLPGNVMAGSRTRDLFVVTLTTTLPSHKVPLHYCHSVILSVHWHHQSSKVLLWETFAVPETNESSNNKLCVRPPQYAPALYKLTFPLLTLKVVSESRVTWATSVPVLVFLSLSVLHLGPMYATDRQTSDAHRRLMPPT